MGSFISAKIVILKRKNFLLTNGLREPKSNNSTGVFNLTKEGFQVSVSTRPFVTSFKFLVCLFVCMYVYVFMYIIQAGLAILSSFFMAKGGADSFPFSNTLALISS